MIYKKTKNKEEKHRRKQRRRKKEERTGEKERVLSFISGIVESISGRIGEFVNKTISSVYPF